MSLRVCACVKTGLAVALGLRYGVECILEASKLAGKWDFETMDCKKTQMKGRNCSTPSFGFYVLLLSLFQFSFHLFSLVRDSQYLCFLCV